MKPILIALAALVVLGLIAFGYVWYAGSDGETVENALEVTFPLATSSPPGEGLGREPFQVATQDGNTLATKNFIQNGVTIEDASNDGNYYLAGSSGACLEDGSCPKAGSESSFNIVYFSSQQSFVVALTEEPLGEARRVAERYLMQSLGITEAQMCGLRYMVGTTLYVSEVYGAMGNLGFSFCPGAIRLP